MERRETQGIHRRSRVRRNMGEWKPVSWRKLGLRRTESPATLWTVREPGDQHGLWHANRHRR